MQASNTAFPRRHRMASQMIVGTGKLQLTGLHPGAMKDACSPGSTTSWCCRTGTQEASVVRLSFSAVDAIQVKITGAQVWPFSGYFVPRCYKAPDFRKSPALLLRPIRPIVPAGFAQPQDRGRLDSVQAADVRYRAVTAGNGAQRVADLMRWYCMRLFRRPPSCPAPRWRSRRRSPVRRWSRC